MKKRSFLILAAVTALFSVTIPSCGPEEEKIIEVNDVVLQCPPGSLTWGEGVGDNFKIEYTLMPSTATNQNVIWNSSNAAVASVDAAGNVTARGLGNARITLHADDGAVSKSCNITVVAREYPVTNVTMEPAEAIYYQFGETLQLISIVTPSNATNPAVEYSSDKPDVAEVDKNTGLVTTVGCGEAIITVTTADGDFTATSKITVYVPVTGVTVRATLDLEEGDERDLLIEVLPATACNKAVTWESSNKAVATVDEKGRVTAVAEGTAKITVTTVDGAKKAECVVTVTEPPPYVPPTGADFEKAIVYDYSYDAANAARRYPGFDNSNGLRFVNIDKDHVFVSGRGYPMTEAWPTDAYEPHLITLADLKQGALNRIPLNMEGVIPSGTNHYTFASGTMAHGNMYVVTLCLDIIGADENGTLKVYHWNKNNPNAPVNVTKIIKSDIPDVATSDVWRLGDWINADLNESGDGYLYLKRNGQPNFLRLQVRNFSDISEPTSIKFGDITDPGPFATFKKVDGSSDEYLLTGHASPVRLINSNGDILHQLSFFTRNADGIGAKIINFNDARYLVTLNGVGVGDKSKISVYDITKGNTTKEALEIFDSGTGTPMFSYQLDTNYDGDVTWNAGVASIDVVKDGNDKLYVIASASITGLVLVEFPPVPEDEE